MTLFINFLAVFGFLHLMGWAILGLIWAISLAEFGKSKGSWL